MRKHIATILFVALCILAPAALRAQTPAEVRFEQLRAERFQAVAAMATEGSVAPVPVLASPEPLASFFDPPWRAHLSEQEWQLVQESFQAEGVPLELLEVGWVESRFNPLALSPKGARGVWQFMPETARRYGLQVDDRRDDRTDLGRSTRAAARHLSDLYRQFGDWPLVLAAYNAGADRVDAAVTRAGTRDFWRLRHWLPLETQQYVPAVLRTVALPRRDGMIVGPHQRSRAQRSVASVSIPEPSH